ncbi:uncharacterized protein [Antedon mediterranea]|uniref:uncharacterized protein n=1 Tax=Antedon mediterranea TaxID=105859 RepID=UPI003AF5AACA
MAESYIEENMFLDLKQNLSKLYDGDRYLWLRFCLYDHLDLGDITQPDNNAQDLFNALEIKGFITSTNVKLLLEVTKLTEYKSAVDLVIQYMKDIQQNTDTVQLSPFRTKLFKSLKQIDPNAFNNVISCYDLKKFDLKKIWNIVLHLEMNGQLADEPGLINRFASYLGQRSQNILLNRGVALPVTINSNCKLDRLTDCLKSLEQQNKLNQSLPPSIKVNGLGINDSKASIFFRMCTKNRKAVKDLMDMHVEGVLIQGLADILEPENRQKFFEDWTTDIVLNEFIAALRKLGVQLVVTLVKDEKSSSVTDSEQPYALELLFKLMEKQKEWSTTAVAEVHKTIECLTDYFKRKNLQFQKVETGSIVFHFVSHDSEALAELWKMYCNESLHMKLASILGTDDHQKQQLLDITIHEEDYKNAMIKLGEFNQADQTRTTNPSIVPLDPDTKVNIKDCQTDRQATTSRPTIVSTVPPNLDTKVNIKDCQTDRQATTSTTASTVPPNLDTKKITPKEEFVECLECLSDRYKGDKHLWLRLLLHNHCSGQALSKEDVPALEWFNELERTGCINYNPTDVEILLDIAKVTEEKKAIDLIEQFKVKHPNNNEEYNFTEGKPITEYRKRLFAALRENTTSVSTMLAHYSLGHLKVNNIWDFVFILERDTLLVDERSSMEHFAKLLDKKASDIFLEKESKKLKMRLGPLSNKSGNEEENKIMREGREQLSGEEQTDRRATSATASLEPLYSKTKVSAKTMLQFIDENGLECSICQQRFTNPKTLRCLHTYCLNCLQYLIRQHGKIRCRKCPQMYRLKDDDLKHLKCNEKISYLVEYVEKIESKKTEICSSCTNQPKYYCFKYEKYLCGQCIQQYKNMPALNSLYKLDTNVEHVVIPMQTPNQTKRAKSIKNKLKEKLDVITKDRSELESNFKLSRTEIEIHESTIIRKVKEESKVMMANLTQIYEEQSKFIDNQIEHLESKLTQVNTLTDNKMMSKLPLYQTADEMEKSLKTKITPKFIPSQKLVELITHEGVGKLITVGDVHKVNEEDENISVIKEQPFSVRVSSLAESDVGQLTATLSNSSGDKSITEVTHRKGEYTITGRCNLEGDWQMDIIYGDMSHVIGSPVSIKVEPFGLVHTIDNFTKNKYTKLGIVTDVAVDSDGFMLVSDTYVNKFDPSGNFDSRIQIPQNVKVNQMPKKVNRMHQIGNGHMVYSCNSDKCVVMCDNQYHEIRTFGKGVLKYPNGLTVNQKTRILYVADCECHCVFKFNIDDGSLLGKIGSEGRVGPSDVTLTKEGHVIVADCNNHRIQILDSNDNLIKNLVGYGKKKKIQNFHAPQGITTDKDGNIIVSSINKLQLFDKNGKFIKRIDKEDDGLAIPLGIAVISKRPRRVAVANHSANNFKIFNY